MNFTDLDDAFRELEHRADASSDDLGASVPRRHRHSPSRPLLVAASSIAVLAIAAGVGLAVSDHGSHGLAAGGDPSTPVVSSSPTVSTASESSSPSPTASATSPATDVPKTQAELVERFRSILGDKATFTVDSAHSSFTSSDELITGVLTSSAGTSGFYVLEVVKGVGLCGSSGGPGQSLTPLPCPGASTLADGSQLKVDPDFPDGPKDGVMNDAILNRPDGWQINLYTANVEGKYEGAPVLGKTPALTTAQVTDVVTSPQWLTK